MENLRAMSVRLLEVPMEGSLVLLLAMIGVFMLANLAVGFTFSTLARNQLQAMQMTFLRMEVEPAAEVTFEP